VGSEGIEGLTGRTELPIGTRRAERDRAICAGAFAGPSGWVVCASMARFGNRATAE
jgi:hypothetical protein